MCGLRFLIKGFAESQIKFFFKKYPFFCLFFALFDQNSETILQMAILGEKQKNFFFENFIKMLKPLWSSIFDQRIYWATD